MDKILLEDSYSRTLKGLRVEQKALSHFVEQKLPRVARHLEAHGCDMSLLGTEWVLCVFTTSLPPETTARVWDALLHEGAKVLYRVALALFKVRVTCSGEPAAAPRQSCDAQSGAFSLFKPGVMFLTGVRLSCPASNPGSATRQIMEPQLLAADNLGEIIQLLQKGARGMHDRDRLMDVAFNSLGSMSHHVVDVRLAPPPGPHCFPGVR